MAEIAEITPQYTLKLPPEIATRYRPADRFTISVEGDTLHLKYIGPTRPETPEPATVRARTPLGEQLRQVRAEIVASGELLLGWAELEQEIADRRGERGQDDPA